MYEATRLRGDTWTRGRRAGLGCALCMHVHTREARRIAPAACAPRARGTLEQALGIRRASIAWDEEEEERGSRACRCAWRKLLFSRPQRMSSSTLSVTLTPTPCAGISNQGSAATRAWVQAGRKPHHGHHRMAVGRQFEAWKAAGVAFMDAGGGGRERERNREKKKGRAPTYPQAFFVVPPWGAAAARIARGGLARAG